VVKIKKIVSYPQMGDYNIPVFYFLTHILKCEVKMPPKISDKTVELGNKYSPTFVCMPFKYTLGTLIECLDNNANVLIQLGGGCRYGYYYALQENILHDLGYSFEFINLVTAGRADLKKIISNFKKIDPHISIFKSIYYLFITTKMVKYMDNIDIIIRKNIGFEIKENSHINLKKQMLESFSNTKGYINLLINYLKYKRKFKKIPLKNKKRLKVGIIGELYTIMEPFANYDLEMSLSKFGIEVKRFTNATYLLFKKKKIVKKYLKKVFKYSKNKLGADALDNIGRMVYLCENKYDGVIHIKSSFCTPEIGIMPILRRISKDYEMPLLFFSFDTNTSKVGIETRLEAFYDMIEMRKKNE
jgi:predicted nucleotide-binding protein (sugar kinase/HSP70/actin superfamily)